MNRYQSGTKFKDTDWEFIENLKALDFAEINKDTFEKFAQFYKDPLYSFLRFSGYCREDSEDIVQEMFQELVQSNLLRGARESDGKLRTYLIGAVKRIVSKRQRKANTQKRGGDILHLDIEEANHLSDNQHTPDRLFDREWSRSLISEVTNQLFGSQPQLSAREVDILSEMLNWNTQGMSYKDASAELGMSLAALKSKVFRLRVTFKQLLFEHIASTLSNPTLENIENEIKTLKKSWD